MRLSVRLRSAIQAACVLMLVYATCATRAQTPAPTPAVPDLPAPVPAVATGSIHGVVEGKDGQPYEGIEVTLSSGGAEQSAQTNAAGEFQFATVAPGPFKLVVTSQGFDPQIVSAILEPGEAYAAPSVILAVKTTITDVHVSAQEQFEIAETQIHLEEKQRVFGIMPNYFVSYSKNPVPLTPRQKFSLSWHSSVDPFSILTTAGFAGIEQAANSFKGYGQGMQGYGKRFGAGLADTFNSNMIGGWMLPSLFRQDPRYFYKGTGTIKSRIGYAIANSVICKGDNMRWQFNYSGIIGGLAAGGISNLYYPTSNRSDAAVTFENAGIGIAGSAIQNLFQEFLVKKLTPGAGR
jgi:hypothetical protein